MKYELAILTHGRASTFSRAIESFAAQVRPAPTSIRVFADGVRDMHPVAQALRSTFPTVRAAVAAPAGSRGFCAATATLWASCVQRSEADYVFWLEHDFLIERRVSMEQLASLLDQESKLAQVVLVRQAVNGEERRAGGVVQARPDAFAFRQSIVHAEDVDWKVDWLEHRAFYTTNPGLMRLDFMSENPWPNDDEPHCEGRFGLDLIERGYRFAYWGDGFPWVRHIGHRDGHGY